MVQMSPLELKESQMILVLMKKLLMKELLVGLSVFAIFECPLRRRWRDII